MRTYAFSLLCCLFLFAACKKDDLDQTSDKLVGDWAWQGSTGGILGSTLTPASEGFTEAYLFKKNGQFVRTRNDSTLMSAYYWVEKGSSIFHTEEVYLLKIGNQAHSQVLSTMSIEFTGNDSLQLSEECADCFMHSFTRKN